MGDKKVTGLDRHIGRDLLITIQQIMMMSSALLYNLHMPVLLNCDLLRAKERNVFLDSTKFRSAQTRGCIANCLNLSMCSLRRLIHSLGT